MKRILLSLATIIFASIVVILGLNLCSKQKTVWNYLNQPSHCENVLKEAVLSEGKIEAYNELSIAFLDYKVSEEFLIYALIMANKYDYPQAFYDVFIALTHVYWSDLTEIDEKTAEMAIKYLIGASERGHHQAKGRVEKYGINIEDNAKNQILTIYRDMLIRQGYIEK